MKMRKVDVVDIETVEFDVAWRESWRQRAQLTCSPRLCLIQLFAIRVH